MTAAPANPDNRYIRFANGKVWEVTDNVARTFVRLDLSDIVEGDSLQDNLEAFLDRLADESVADARFTDIRYTVIAHNDGELTFECFANVEDILADIEPDSTDVATANVDEHFACLAEFFGWDTVEARHAQDYLDDGDDVAAMAASECVVRIANGRELRSPAYPAACEYVRITSAGYEIAYWDHQEWRHDPQVVMGALIAVAHGAMP